MLAILLLHQLFNAVDLYLTDINLALESRKLNLRFLMSFFLRSCDTIELNAHVLYLLCLSMVDISLASNVLMALFDLKLSGFVLLGHFSLRVFRFRQLNFNISQGVFQLFVFNLTKSQHLAIFDFCAFLVFDAQATANNTFVLTKEWYWSATDSEIRRFGSRHLLLSLQSPC